MAVTYTLIPNVSPDPMSCRVKTPNSPEHVVGKVIFRLKFPVAKSTA